MTEVSAAARGSQSTRSLWLTFLELGCKLLVQNCPGPSLSTSPHSPRGMDHEGHGESAAASFPCHVRPAGTAQPSNLLSAFLEELLGRFLLQPLTTGIHQL